MRVGLTGAAGHLGQTTWRALLDAGHEVVATDRRFRAELPGPLKLADLADPFAAYELTDGIDALIHVAAIPNQHAGPTPQDAYITNTTITCRVVQAALERGVRRIAFASSIQAAISEPVRREDGYPMPPYLPLDSRLPADPRNLYALSKVHGEQLLEMMCGVYPDLTAVAVRLPWLVSPRFMERSRRWMDRGPIPLDRLRRMLPEQGFTHLHRDDAGRLMAAAATQPDLAAGHHLYLPSAVPSFAGLGEDVLCRLHPLLWPGVALRDGTDRLDRLVDDDDVRSDLVWQHVENPLQLQLDADDPAYHQPPAEGA